ncbi:hypothetical protein JCM30760_14500 [Thiomicrorhabdus hydrogeniphila]
MKIRNTFKLTGLTTALLCASLTVNAGQIVSGPQGAPSAADGFGAFNLDNVEVKIINAETGVDTGKVYTESTGAYDAMVAGDSFISEMLDENSVITGILHGKDWPLGEPSGVKVVNDTLGKTLSHSRPASCLLSTSYFKFGEDPDYTGATPDDGWLDSANPNPTMCDSPFQTHKRFKVDAITPTEAEVQADSMAVSKPIDLVINVNATSGETDIRRYMVLQKLNNYSDKRFTGFTVEVGFGVGAAFKTVAEADAAGSTVNNGATKNLTLSLGVGEDTDKDGNPVDMWDPEDLAPFSAGLFGTADDQHPHDGFFDTRRAAFNVAVDATETKISSGAAFPSNYATIFGDWLPSKWEPTGIFYDEDKDPLTDGVLVAFWGEDTDGSYKWLQGNAESFAPATDAQLYAWSHNTAMPDGSSQYAMETIEDVLNLGLSYIVDLGDVTTFPATNFTIRMTPIAQANVDATEPGWISTPAIDPGDAVSPGYVPPVDTTTSSGGGSASSMSEYGVALLALIILALGGWVVRKKMSN